MKKYLAIVLALAILASMFGVQPTTSAYAGIDEDRQADEDQRRFAERFPITNYTPFSDPRGRFKIDFTYTYETKELALEIRLREPMQDNYKIAVDWFASKGFTVTNYSPELMDAQFMYFSGGTYQLMSIAEGYSAPNNAEQDRPGNSRCVLEYIPQNGGNSVELRVDGAVDELLTTQSYESMKLFALVEAAQEMAERLSGGNRSRYEEYMRNFFQNTLGFASSEPFKTGDDWYGNDATGWFACKKMPDGRSLVFTFVQGTDDNQWVSDFNINYPVYLSAANLFFKQDHEGFKRAAEKVGPLLAVFADTNGCDPNNSFFAFDGYSRGAGVVDYMASRSKIPGTGVALSDNNCMAYTFETPNTVSQTPDRKVSRVIDVVDGNDIVPFAPPGWHKNGVVLGYTHLPGKVANYYGVDNINEGLFEPHLADNLIANVFSYEPSQEWDKAKFDHTSVRCPTNIVVVHNNKVVASVIGQDVTTDGSVLIYASFSSKEDDGEKEIITPFGGDYQILVEATGDGVMELAKETIGYEQVETVQAPQTYALAAGEFYEIDRLTGQARAFDYQADRTGVMVLGIIAGMAVLAGVLVCIRICLSASIRRRKGR